MFAFAIVKLVYGNLVLIKDAIVENLDTLGDKKKIDFTIIQESKTEAIISLIESLNSGYRLTLNDNRDKRCGAISLKLEDGKYLSSGGGHGFSLDWKVTTLKDIEWLIKVTSPFNIGERSSDYGSIEKTN